MGGVAAKSAEYSSRITQLFSKKCRLSYVGGSSALRELGLAADADVGRCQASLRQGKRKKGKGKRRAGTSEVKASIEPQAFSPSKHQVSHHATSLFDSAGFGESGMRLCSAWRSIARNPVASFRDRAAGAKTKPNSKIRRSGRNSATLCRRCNWNEKSKRGSPDNSGAFDGTEAPSFAVDQEVNHGRAARSVSDARCAQDGRDARREGWRRRD